MMGQSAVRKNQWNLSASFRPAVESLEERYVLDSLPFVPPPGQNILQYTNAVLQNLEAYRLQANNLINAVEAQQIANMNQNLSLADQVSQALIARVTQDRQQFNTDIANGAPLQTQINDLAQIQIDGQAAGAGVGLIAQFKQLAIQQTIQELQVDEQLRFSITQMINQQESSFVNQVLPAILAAQQAIAAAGPQVGAPLTAGQTATYSGVITSTINQPGVIITITTTNTLTLTVGANGVSLFGPISATVTTQNDIDNIPTTMTSTSGSISGQLLAPNSTAVNLSFVLNFPDGAQPGTTIGFLGSDLFVGQTTSSTTGVTSLFTLQRVG